MNVLQLNDARLFTADVLNDLTLKIFRPKLPAFKNADYLESYSLWKHSWGYALREEMNQKTCLYSDHFTRQQMIVSLFSGDECLGLFTSNQFDLRLACDRDDTYFIDWPDEVLDEIESVSPHALTLCVSMARKTQSM